MTVANKNPINIIKQAKHQDICNKYLHFGHFKHYINIDPIILIPAEKTAAAQYPFKPLLIPENITSVLLRKLTIYES